jgi:NADPH-ferrihemoprotein reductase
MHGILWAKPDRYHHLWFEVPQLTDGAHASSRSHTRNIVEHLDQVGKKIVIFWGSQSGTSERFAQRLSRELRLKLDLESLVADISDYDVESIALLTKDHLAIFLLSTYGEGDPSDNAATFWDWLRGPSIDPETFRNLNYMAFGLGNSSYVSYNRVVDVVVQRLNDGGAQVLAEPGRADDAKSETEEHFLSWKDSTISILSKRYQIDIFHRPVEPSLSVVHDPSLDVQDLYLGQPLPQGHQTGCSTVATLPIRAHRELLHQTTNRNCLHLEIDLSKHPKIAYKTGDHLGIFASNSDTEVDAIIDAMALQERRHLPVLIQSTEAGAKVNLPSPTTIDALLRYYLEICAPVSRDTMQSLKPYAPSTKAAQLLDALSQDQSSYSDFLATNHMTMGRMLRLGSLADDTPRIWSKLNMAHLLDLIPRMQPRYYSISSSSVVTPRFAHLTILVSPSALPRSKSVTIPGLATNYLLERTKDMSIGRSQFTHGENITLPLMPMNHIFAFTRRSKFKLPLSHSCPIVMVAAGTGIAPFRAFIQERAQVKNGGRVVGEMLLFFGCHHPENDCIYDDEFREHQGRLGDKLTIIHAFSRLNPHSKIYVQDKVLEHGAKVMNLIDDGATMYVCGRTDMARDVAKAARELRMTAEPCTMSEAESWVNAMKKTRKWQEDVWG